MIQISLEKDETTRELCIVYFKDLYMCEALNKEQIRRGFDLIYIDMYDILLDTPMAMGYLFKMIEGIVFKVKLFSESFLYRIPDTLLNTKMYVLLTL
jgi:hypothetical protein